MEPTAREKYNQKTAKLYVIALEQTGATMTAIAAQQIVQDAGSIYCNRDYTSSLCALIKHNGSEFIYADAKNRDLRDLATWWEDHQAGEARRAAEDELVKSQAAARITAWHKLTVEERLAYGFDPDLPPE